MDEPSKPRSLQATLEIGTAAILSIAALATSWTGYQSALWDGEQAAHYSRAIAGFVSSSAMSTRAGQLQGLDVMMFSQWASAHTAKNPQLEEFYRARFRPEFARAFQDWIAQDPLHNPKAPSSPFTDPRYHNGVLGKAEAAKREASHEFTLGQQANANSDHFLQGSVLLASAMFFGGMCQAFHTPKVRIALIVIALIACAFGLSRLTSLPAIRL